MITRIQIYFTRFKRDTAVWYAKAVDRFAWIPKMLVLLGVLLLIKISLDLYAHWAAKKPRPLIVQTTQAVVKPMPVLLTAPGSITAVFTGSITSQVTGTVKHIGFQRGDMVKEGQLLFSLDQAPFLESLRQAQANHKRDEATLAQNNADAARYAALADKEYVTKQQAEQTAAVARAQAALVEADLAQVQLAEVQLGYTNLFAPMTGRPGDYTVNPGDLVVANSATPLITVNKTDPLWVNFSLTQTELASVLQYQRQGALTVNIWADELGNHTPMAKGELVLIDNAINTQTGTIALKAKLLNPEQKLWPGMMVNAELVLRIEPNAIVIPTNAIQFDQKGNFIYCIENHKAALKRVVVSRQIKNEAVIADGLTGHEWVITTISPDLKEGSLVRTE